MSILLGPSVLGADTPGPRLRVRTVAVPDPGPLLALLPEAGGLAWVHDDGDGMVAWGEVARLGTAGPTDAAAWWATLVETSDIRSELDDPPPGSGLVAFGSFTFDTGRATASSGLVVPRTVMGRRSGRVWLTQVDLEHEEARPPLATVTPPVRPERVHVEGGSLTALQWKAAVSRAVDEIDRGRLDKVVLARDVVAVAASALDLRWIAARLAETHPQCWTYLVDGLVGSTPEMLVRLEAGVITSRVLAGTVPRSGDVPADLTLASALLRSDKDLREHAYAVASVAAALRPLATDLDVPERPRVLELPELLHLASDLTATPEPGATALGLVAALHPSAAVCGTPTVQARRLLGELEHLDRERYAGPVGWTDAAGDGEWAIALRGGILDESDPRRIRLFAGCGIVAASDPAAEWDESQAKLASMLCVLEALPRRGAEPDLVPRTQLDVSGTPSTGAIDEPGLGALVTRLLQAFNDADATAFADCFTLEAVWVNLYGDHMVGRGGIETGHRQAFDSRLADAVLLPGPVRATRVTEDVRHVLQRWTLRFPEPGAEGRVAARSGTMVLLACRAVDGSWTLAGGTNVADQARA